MKHCLKIGSGAMSFLSINSSVHHPYHTSIAMTANSKGNASAAANCVNVLTKTHDGGAKAAANDSEPAAKRPRQPVRKHEDPFMYYSDQETRMNELHLNGDNENDEQVARESDERKTRISFELDPKVLLADLFHEPEP